MKRMTEFMEEVGQSVRRHALLGRSARGNRYNSYSRLISTWIFWIANGGSNCGTAGAGDARSNVHIDQTPRRIAHTPNRDVRVPHALRLDGLHGNAAPSGNQANCTLNSVYSTGGEGRKAHKPLGKQSTHDERENMQPFQLHPNQQLRLCIDRAANACRKARQRMYWTKHCPRSIWKATLK
jgi:hypothetical protein